MLYPLCTMSIGVAAATVLGLLVGCGGNGTVPGIAGPEGDASSADAQDGADAFQASPPCEMPLTGAGPLGMQLEALDNPLGDPHSSAPHYFAIFFPEGRLAGSTGYLVDERTGPDVHYQALMVAGEFAVDADLGADVEIDWGRKYSDFRMKARLIGPSDGIDANFSDVDRMHPEAPRETESQDKLCPVSGAHAIKLVSNLYYGPYGPNSTITFSSSGPIDPASVTAEVTSAGQEIHVDTQFVDLGKDIRLSPQPGQAFPPNQPVEVNWSGTKDVLGRDVVPYYATEPLVTTSVVTDSTFTADPPFGSIAVSWSEMARKFEQTDGVINLAPIGLESPYEWYFYSWLTALIALPDPGTATHVRLKASTSGGCTVRFTVTDAAGAAADFATTDEDPATVDNSVGIPGAGPLWLSAYAERTIRHDVPPPTWCAILVDEVVFE